MPLLEMRGITKRFGSNLALGDVSISLDAGKVLALCGANGAGKSTLVRILAGVEHADRGSVLVNGERVSVSSPEESARLGFSFVHQELNMVPSFTAFQNIAMGADYSGTFGLLARARTRRRAQEVLDRIGASVHLDTRVDELSLSDRWMVSLARSLMRDARIVALDEPTASFTVEEAERLFRVIDELTASGVGILYISHRLEEVLRLADDVTVFGDGRVVGTYDAGELDVPSLTHHIVGRAVEAATARSARSGTASEALLTTKELSRGTAVRDVSLTLGRGEVVGLAGLVGAGRTELARLLCGADAPTRGTMELSGVAYRPRTPRDGIRAGVALVPEERRTQALVLQRSVSRNLLMASLQDSASRFPFYSARREVRVARATVATFGIKARSIHDPVSELSGGNQQKVVVGKYVLAEPKLLILDEPTVGVDVGARADLYEIIRGLADAGTTILLISSDFTDLAICDRVLVMREGSITADVPIELASKSHLTALSFGTTEQEKTS